MVSDPPPAATMAGVGELMKLVRQVLGNWKVGNNCELVLSCNAGLMKVNMSADLGIWVQPTRPHTSDTGDRGHLGSRRRADPSYLRRLRKRAAERAAAATAEQAAATSHSASSLPAAEQAADATAEKATEDEAQAPTTSPSASPGTSPAASIKLPGKK